MRGQAPYTRVSSLQEPIHDPPMYAARVLAETLRASGIAVGGVQRDRSMRGQRGKGLSAAWPGVAARGAGAPPAFSMSSLPWRATVG